MRSLWLLSSLVLCIFSCGCVPGQLIWSPDGRRAAYLPEAGQAAYIVDDQGKIVTLLGESYGGFAWTTDSRTLYFASIAEGGGPDLIQEDRRWLEPSGFGELRGADRLDRLTKDDRRIIVSVWRDGRAQTLFATRQFVPLYMSLSPDQRWLGVAALVEGRNDDARWFSLYAWSFAQKRLYTLCEPSPVAFCFTKPSRIAYARWRVDADKKTLRSELVEATLDDRAATLARTRLGDALIPFGGWLCAAGDDIIFTALSAHRPDGNDLFEVSPHQTLSLYRFRRASGQIERICSNIGPALSISPDATRLLFTQYANEEQDDPRHTLIELRSGKVHPLGQAFDDRVGDAIWPTWRTNDTISFALTAAPGEAVVRKNATSYYELGLYRIAGDGNPTLLRLLSSGWPLEMKPHTRDVIRGRPVTRPAQ